VSFRQIQAGLKKIIVLLLFLSTIQVNAQVKADLQILSTADGLSQGMVYDILQSRDGFIWIATNDGLNRYDGSRFEVFSPNAFNPFAIGSGVVNGIFEDHRGWIWLSFPDGMDVFNPKIGRFFHVRFDGKPIFSNWLPSFTETTDGTIWFADNDQLWKIELSENALTNALQTGNADIEPTCRAFALKSSNGGSEARLKVASLLYTKSGKLLLNTNQGLLRFDTATGMTFPDYDIPKQVMKLAENKAGEIIATASIPGQANRGAIYCMWISDSGIRTRTESYKSDSDASFNFSFDEAGYWWVVRNQVIQKWRLSTFFSNGKPELEIPTKGFLLNTYYSHSTKLIFDRSGTGWIGTNGFGLLKVNEKISKFKTALPNTSQRMLREAPDGALYALETPGVLYRSKTFERGERSAEFFTSPKLLNTLGNLWLCFDPSGNAWALNRTDSLLFRLDAVTKAQKSFSWSAEGLLCDRNGNLLGVTKTGLRKFDPRTETRTDYPFDKPRQRTTEYSWFLYEDVDGVIWIFGLEGLIKAIPDQSDYRFQYFRNNPSDPASLSLNTVLSVTDDPLEPRRYLWVGTKGGGLNRLDKQSCQCTHFYKEQGLPDNVVYGILSENASAAATSGYIWLSTNRGLCRFDVRTEKTKNFTVADGLPNSEFNSSSYLKTKDGTMIFGGINGLTIFHPDSLRYNEHVPRTAIVGLKVNNQKYELTDQADIRLAYNQNLLLFDFAALEYTDPAQNQYRYQLVGVDMDWVELGSRNSVQFANLAPGTYTFRVLGSNNDGIWSEQPAELTFVIRPPWWASWWAFMGYSLLVGGVLWLLYRYRLRERMKHQETLRLRELNDFKSRFFTNITHEFRTPLTVVLGLSEQLSKDEADSSKKAKIGLIQRSGENLLRLINQILDLAKLDSNALKMNYIQGDILTFVKYIAESLHSLANAQNLLLRVESEQVKIMMDYDPERLLQIVHNLLSNAIKFTPSGGKVLLRADVHNQWLHLSVVDSGAGIPADELPNLFERFFQARNQEYAKAGGTGIGLSLTRELVKVMGGDISVESTLGVGSTFLVKLPVTNQAAFEEKDTWNNVGAWKIPSPFTPEPLLLPADLSVPTVLLIEDNPDVVEYLTACFRGGRGGDREGRPYGLDFAYNGQAGIEKALETVPDLIVSDVMMPIKDGFEVLETLKNNELTSHIPIILLTSKADVQSRLAGLRSGADAYLSKPFHQEELLVTVANLLETRRKLQLKYQQNVLASGSEETITADPENSFLQKVRAIVEANYQQEDFGLPQLCQKIGISRSQLFRKMKALTDLAPSDLIRTHRLNKARILLETGVANVTEAAWQVGFKDPSYFSKMYQEEFGEAPSATRK